MCGFMVLRGAFGQSVTTISANGTVAVSEIEVKIAARRALERTLTRARSVRVRLPRALNARNWPLHYLALQGKPILGIYRGETGWVPTFGLMASPESMITLPW